MRREGALCALQVHPCGSAEMQREGLLKWVFATAEASALNLE